MGFHARLEGVGKLTGGEVIKQHTAGSFGKFGYKEGLVRERGRMPREERHSFLR